MVSVNILTSVVMYIKENSKTIAYMAREFYIIQTVMYTKEILQMIFAVEKVEILKWF